MASQIEPLIMDKLNNLESRYQANLEFFKKYVPAIYKLVIEDTHKPEINIDPNTHQIQRLRDNNLVYPCDPIQHAQLEVSHFVKSFETKVYPPTPLGITVTHLIKEKAFNRSADHYGEIIEKYGRNNLKPAIKDIIIFGIGMGYHIEMLCNKITFKNITIIDHEVKNLKTSMYCINWEKILKKLNKGTSITIHVRKGENHQEEFEKELKNHCFRLFPTIGISTIIYNHQPDADEYNDDKKIIDEFATYIKVSNELIGPEAQRLFNANENIKNNFKAIDLEKSTISNDKIIAVVGAGPSLDKYIDIIRENRSKFFLISAGSSLSSLVKLGVDPDLHFELEFQNLATTLLNYVNEEYDLKKLDIICTYEANPGFPKLFKNAYMFIPESSELANQFAEANILRQGGITCSNGATAFISRITNNDIYLFGIDFAHTGGTHHSKTNISMNENLPKDLERVHTTMKNRKTVMEVISTSGEIIHTSAGLNAARISMEAALQFKTGNFYNCSHGAEILGTKFMSEQDLLKVVLDKKESANSCYEPKTMSLDSEKIHKKTQDLLKNSIASTHLIIENVKKFTSKPVDNTLRVIDIFSKLPALANNDQGQMRNMLSVSKAPLLQLFVICNYMPEDVQKELVNTWLKDYTEYSKFLEELFTKICKNKDYFIENDWIV